VVLVVNAAKATRTIASVVKGCQIFDPEVNIAGVILNRIGGSRHRRVVTDAIETYCSLPVVGAVPRLGSDESLIPGRHLGLVPPTEFPGKDDFQARLAEISEQYLAVSRLLEIADGCEGLVRPADIPVRKAEPDVKIGYFSDSAFTFYYPENLEALRNNGAELIPISSVADDSLPQVDGLYIGGGFPETHVEQLTRNRAMMQSVKEAAECGMPVYAECGGLIYLSRTISWKGRRYRMAGVFPVDLTMSSKPVGHGYCEFTPDRPNPFFETGVSVRGHEFHYSGLSATSGPTETCMRVQRGMGLGQQRDGLLYKAALACYTHIHAGGATTWAPNFVAAARSYRESAPRSRGENESKSGPGCEPGHGDSCIGTGQGVLQAEV
jgi:cobyrinic acid a,c-diamide synthase